MSSKLLAQAFLSNQTVYFLFFTAFNMVLLIIRSIYANDTYYNFMLWNLFLAAIPYLVAKVAYLHFQSLNKSFDLIFFILCGIWLVFFPNAPYVITDFFHLKVMQPVPLWFDLIMISSFALQSLLFGLFSLNILQTIITYKMRILGWAFIGTSLLLGSIGIYIGRYLRWNSWDIITNPYYLFINLKDVFANPLVYKGLYGFSFFFTFLMIFVYMAFYMPKRQ